MSPAQAELLRQLIVAEQAYWIASSQGKPVSNDDRGVEVSKANGHSWSTARVLQEAGLIDTVDVGNGMTLAFLGKYLPET